MYINKKNIRKYLYRLYIKKIIIIQCVFRKKLSLKIYKSLKHGGSLIFVDKIRSSSSNFEDMINQVYFDFKIENKLNHAQVLNKSKITSDFGFLREMSRVIAKEASEQFDSWKF